jgi:thiamine-monophosphate kinase
MAKKNATPAGEDSLINLFKNRYPATGPLIRKGIGDDAAVVRLPKAREFLVITSDMLMEGIDFHRHWITARLLGRKSISVNLSDLAAMGARPRFFTVSLAITPDIPKQWILDFHDGLTEKAGAFGAQLVGGDLSGAQAHIAISVTAIGESLNRKVVYRSGGKPGDLLYVTGTLGRASAGLMLLQKQQTRGRHRAEALRAHRDPEPRCEAGEWLSQSGLASCMMDLSDGLSADLPRICAASGVGADIRLQDLPIFKESASWGGNPIELALHGGEDYELLFAVPRSKAGRLEKSYPSNLPPITCVGKLTAASGKIWITDQTMKHTPLPRHGWDHFKP